MSTYRGVGVAYYPEHWDPSMWEPDVDRMVQYGVDTVRIAEFAWGILEPREGEYNIGYFDDFVDLCADRGLRVIFGTPTATPPQWMQLKYPEILNQDRHGHAIVGPRRNYTYNSEKYLEFSDQIVTRLAEHYGPNKTVVGWQIDNELNCEISEFLSEADDTAFRKYVQDKYGSLEEVNRAFGNTFWSHLYSDWSEVSLRGTYLHDSPNPHLALEAKKFFSWSAIRFLKRQTDLLRPHLHDKAFVTTNGLFGNLDYNELLKAGLDFITFDSYPNFANDVNLPADDRRLEEDPDAPMRDRSWSWNLAWTRSISPTFGIMEQQAGAHGWTSRMEASAPKPGQMRLWTMQSAAHGADFICYFRWRTSPMGNEIYWHGLNDYSNQPNRRLRELQKIAEEWKILEPINDAVYEASVAVLKDYPNSFDAEVDIWHGRVARASDDAWFKATQTSHTPCDFIYVGAATLDDLKRYRVLAYPHAAIMTDQVSNLLRDYVKAGGTLILGARTGYKDEAGLCPMRPMPGLVSDWIGVEVEDYTLVDRNIPDQSIVWGDATLSAPVFNEVLRPTHPETEVIGTFTDDYYAGAPAMVQRNVGEGKVYYVGSTFSPALVNKLLSETKVRNPYEGLVGDVSPSLELAVRANAKGRWMFVLNYDPVERGLALRKLAKDALTGETVSGQIPLEPYGVKILQIG